MVNCKRIGLTGQTGAGKTVVSDMLRERGFAVIDCDRVSRDVVSAGTDCLMELVTEFGVEILQADGTMNRHRLGNIVFNDKKKRIRLNEIIFPHIQAAIDMRIASLEKTGCQTVIMDAPTLFESGIDAQCDKVVSVIAPQWTRKRRILARDNITEEQAESRILAQHPDSFYTSRSDFVIENEGGIGELLVTVLEMISALGLESMPPLKRDIP